VKTLTLFNALSYVQDGIEEIKVDLAANGAGMPADEHSLKLRQLSRLVRQRITFKDAIRARLTPPRTRVRLVTVGDTFASVARTDKENAGAGYFVTPASHRRLLDVCERHMIDHGEQYGVHLFTREVKS
jgi:hypothetical protein